MKDNGKPHKNNTRQAIFLIVLLAAVAAAVIVLTAVYYTGEKESDVIPSRHHDVIDVSNEIYVQHDADNNDVYALKKSGGGTTTVYKMILPEFTANKVWTKSGEFTDNVGKYPQGATSPENYIPVTAGERYFIKIYGIGYAGGKWFTPVLFLDGDDNVVGDMLAGTFDESKSGVEITVPENAAKMHISMFNEQGFTLQKVLELTDEQFDALPVFDKTKLENQIDADYEQYKKDKMLYKKLDKCHVTFVIDDTRAGIDEYADLFISKNVPLVLATIPQNLKENASSQTETRLQTARRVVRAGGEVMSHNVNELKKGDLSDYEKMYSTFVKTKQMFGSYDIDVNGIILSGNEGEIANTEETEKWASSFYAYSDMFGKKYDKKEAALDSVYYHPRTYLGIYSNDIGKIKQAIDDGIKNNSWLVLFLYGQGEIETSVLEQTLDYVNSKSPSELKTVTYKKMYEENAASESAIKNAPKTTYYVSAAGASELGTMEHPMSYETAKRKTFLSGDTVLFKRGDVFYGQFNPRIARVDDKITTFSSYGSGELPVISGFKIADKRASWRQHSEGVYKIDLTDKKCFTGSSAANNEVGFMQNSNGLKYYNKKSALSGLAENYDFYSDGTYLFVKSDAHPFDVSGALKLAVKENMFVVSSNMKVDGLKITGTGAHGIVVANDITENVEITNNVIQDIGGSYLTGTTRYGNGIELYGTNARNITVENNIIRNVYDVGFTMQGNSGSAKNVIVSGNVFVSNSQDSEIWNIEEATGVESYVFEKNISVDCGRGWGYEARPDKHVSAHILFHAYTIENTDIRFRENTVINPRRIYYITKVNGTDVWFKEKDYIKSDGNFYFLAEDSKIFGDSYGIGDKDSFIAQFKKDENSLFKPAEINPEITSVAHSSDSISEIKTSIDKTKF